MASGWIAFIKAALKNPLEVSTIFPTRPALARRMLTTVGLNQGDKLLVEVGTGTGAITRFMEPMIQNRSRYLGIEINPDLIKYLREHFPYLRFECAPAQDVARLAGKESANVVVSSLPWTMFSQEVQEATLSAIHEVLVPGGHFVTFICLNSEVYPSARHFKNLMRKNFARFEKREVEWKNIPPATVYLCTK